MLFIVRIRFTVPCFLSRATAIVVIGPRQIAKPNLTSVATAWVFSQDLGFFEAILGSWVFSEGLGFFLGFSKGPWVFLGFFLNLPENTFIFVVFSRKSEILVEKWSKCEKPG